MSTFRFFNTAGPCTPERNYMLKATARLRGVMQILERGQYFGLHAPRQSGKTTAILALADELRATGNYAAVYATCEAGAVYGDEPEVADRIVAESVVESARAQLPLEQRPGRELQGNPGNVLCQTLAAWAATCPLPIVLFLDEIDALQDRALVGVLRQLRAGYPSRPTGFPSSIVLCGLRDVRDYKVAAGGSPHLGTASPFNIKVESLTLENFTRTEVAELFAQHTADTGQAFSLEASDLAYSLTNGQPWLVNALAHEVVDELGVEGTIAPEHVAEAKERLILSRATHLDSLADNLNEPRVRRVIAPILAGDQPDLSLSQADIEYCLDLGLVRQVRGQPLAIANPIYREVLPRELVQTTVALMPALPRLRWTRADGGLDLDGLLDAFIAFWRENGEWMLRGQVWPEAAHQLVLMAFLQRVVNGGGYVEREYALGSRRLDLLIRWHTARDAQGIPSAEERHALEVKVWRDGRADPLAEGLVQLDAYLDRVGPGSGTLVVFDARAAAVAWEERGLRGEAVTPAGRTVGVLRV